MKRQASMDFDVITGPSMASACPIVEERAGETPPAANDKAAIRDIVPSTKVEPAKVDAA